MSSNDVVVPQPLVVAVAAVTPLVSRFREVPYAELEVQLGCSRDDGSWDPGVSEDTFNEILTMFLDYDGWDSVSEWSDIHDYMFNLEDGTCVCTSVVLDRCIHPSHIVKQRVEMVELRVRNHGRARVSVNKEVPWCSKTLPETVTPHHVRMKKRRSFVRGPWRFFLTRVWQGGSRSMAEEAQSRGVCGYEVEVNFLPDMEYWDNARHTFTYVATSLLMKMVDVLSDEMMCVELVETSHF